MATVSINIEARHGSSAESNEFPVEFQVTLVHIVAG